MKKFILLAALAALFCLPSVAQQPAKTFSITPKVGFGWGDLTGSPQFSTGVGYMKDHAITDESVDYDPDDSGNAVYGTTRNKSKFVFTGGVEAQYQFNRVLGLVFGLGYRHASLDYNYDANVSGQSYVNGADGHFQVLTIRDANWNADYLCVPVLLSAYVYQGLAVTAGLQMDYMFHESSESEVLYTPAEGYTVGASCGLGDQHKVSLSIPVGLSCEYKNVVLDVRYNFGLTNVMRGDFDGGDAPSSRTMAFGVTLGYKFTFGKK